MLILAFIIGEAVGIAVTCCCVSAKKGDRQ